MRIFQCTHGIKQLERRSYSGDKATFGPPHWVFTVGNTYEEVELDPDHKGHPVVLLANGDKVIALNECCIQGFFKEVDYV